MNTADLAKLMNVSETDVVAFVNCLAVHINKGLSLEEAIEKHMEIMTGMVAGAERFAKTGAAKALVVETFFGA